MRFNTLYHIHKMLQNYWRKSFLNTQNPGDSGGGGLAPGVPNQLETLSGPQTPRRLSSPLTQNPGSAPAPGCNARLSEIILIWDKSRSLSFGPVVYSISGILFVHFLAETIVNIIFLPYNLDQLTLATTILENQYCPQYCIKIWLHVYIGRIMTH